MRIHYLQHVPFEGVASMQHFFEEHALQLSCTHSYQSTAFPDLNSFDLLIIMGGPMGVYDEKDYIWLKAEKEFITRTIAAQKFVLGICLGAQLIAEILGATISKNPYKEIGWHNIKFNTDVENTLLKNIFPEQAKIFQWHGDTFTLPENSIPIGSSTACKHQGFIYQNRIIGLQFHLETTPEWVISLSSRFPEELSVAPYVQSPAEMLSQEHHFIYNNQLMNKILMAIKASV